MAKISKTIEALIKAQQAAKLLKKYEERKSALRPPTERPGRDESGDIDVLSSLADFVKDQETLGQTQRKGRISVAQFRRELKWLYDMIDDATKRKKFRRTGNTFQAGRFYTFNYVPRHNEQLEIWDARPVILCLDAKYATHFYKQYSKRPNIGILGVNLHYIPMRARRRILKQLIHDHSGNRTRFKNNQAIDVGVVESLAGVYNAIPRYKSLRQYLRAGKYKNRDGDMVSAGAFNVVQIPYQNIMEILERPSIYESSFVGGRPPGV